MNLSRIIFKNIKYNIKNYVAYLIGHSFIICILFMFLNLISSNVFVEQPSTSIIKENLVSILALMIIFSLTFTLYTTISFTRYRGKEFGVYFTIGLTTKNVIKILFYENSIIAIVSFISGIIGGSVFFKLIYTLVMKILNINNTNMELNIKSYIYIAVISSLIFIFNIMYQIRFLNRFSVVQILKYSSKKYTNRTNLVSSIIGISVFIISTIIFKSAIKLETLNSNLIMIISFILAIICLYFVVGSIMSLILKISEKFKNFYNKNILLLNSLSHRFFAYRIVLYIIILLASGAMMLISTTYSTYKSSAKYINTLYPYDLSFVIKKDLYDKHIEDLRNIIKNSGAKVKNYNEIENIDVYNLRKHDNKISWYSSLIMVVCESNYKNISNSDINVKKNHAILNTLNQNELKDGGLIIDFPNKKGESIISNLFSNKNTCYFNDYTKSKNYKNYIYIPQKNIIYIQKYITNNLDTPQYTKGSSIIINKSDYLKLKKGASKNFIYYDILANLNNNNNYKYIMKNLRYNLNNIGGKQLVDTLIFKKEKLDEETRNNGFILFTALFLGIMLLIGSAVVLYFKVFTSLEDDKKETSQLFKLGLTYGEIRNIIIKELGIVFLVPPIIAVLVVGYYLSRMYRMIQYGNYMWNNSLTVFLTYILIQTVFFIITINKYLSEIRDSIC